MLIMLAYALLWAAALVYVVHTATGNHWAGRGATGLTTIAWATLTGGLVKRGLASGHWPLANRYEFTLCFVWAIVTTYLLLEASWHERRAGPFVLAVALLIATYAVTRPSVEKALMPLPPALRSAWLQVHVLTAMAGYGPFGVAAGLGLMRLGFRNRVFGKNPVSEIEVERMMEKAVALGFPWLTLGILTGAIWAQNAWGRYWGWDPKETWALITWLWYLLLLHVRALRGWRGRRSAALAVIGFGLVLFTFVGVPWLVRTVQLESLHGY